MNTNQIFLLVSLVLSPLGALAQEQPSKVLTPGDNLVIDGIPPIPLEAGLRELRTAVKEEDALKYDERPAWLIPVRHSLGANLMRAGRYAEAEQVYRDDLKRLPDNGWSLFGLTESLRAEGKNAAEIEATKTKFEKVWAKSDTKITSSCLCPPAM